jgi:hypothetical protein
MANGRVNERELREAMRKIVDHANAKPGSHFRMTKDELMVQIAVLERAEMDTEWTVYYP